MSDDKSWCTLEHYVDKVTFTWKPNISSLSDGGEIKSKMFEDVANAVKLRFVMNKYGICLHPICQFRRRYMFKINIPVLNISKESQTYFFPETANIILFEKLSEDYSCLIMFCTVIIEKAFKVSKCKLIDDFGALVNAEKFSDVTIETAGGHKIPAHKLMLSARSNVFAAMFNHDMMENQMNCVKIEDFSQEVVMEMLRYMYTGSAPKLKEFAEDLLVAADKYGLDELKKMCLESLSDNLCIETAARVFKLADVYEETELVLESLQFIKKHAESVAKTPNWKSLWESDKDLIIKEFIEPKALIPMDDEDLKVAKKRKLQ